MPLTIKSAVINYKDPDTGDYVEVNAVGDTAHVTDVQVNGTSVVTDNVANVPMATSNILGVVKPSNSGIQVNSNGQIFTKKATSSLIKSGENSYDVICPYNQHESVFYALAKLAGADMKNSSNSVGEFTDEAKIAIQKMLGLYEAPWELIKNGTFTNETETYFDISTDNNGSPFELTDCRIMISLPQQDNEASIGAYGRIKFYYDDNANDACYISAWTQAPGGTAKGGTAEIIQEGGMIIRHYTNGNTSGNSPSILANNAFEPGMNSQWQLTKKTYTKIRIDAVKGTCNYYLFGKRKWE